MIKLWHYTNPQNRESIEREGFRPRHPDDWIKVVYFVNPGCREHEVRGEPHEVTLDLSDEEVGRYSHPQKSDWIWDEDRREMVQTTDSARIVEWTLYRIPFAVVNARMVSIRLVPPEERRQTGC